MKNCRSSSATTWVAFLSALTITSGLTFPTTRRTVFKSWGSAALSTVAFQNAAGAATTPKTVSYQSDVDNFSLSIPSSWNIITRNKDGQSSGQLFSAIDLQSGSVVNVVRERPCEMKLYIEQPTRCELFVPTTGLLSDETIQKDVSKLLVRYDERDNAVLDGITRLDSLTRNIKGGLEIVAVTTIPTGGTYRDGMGLDQPDTLNRIAKAHVVVQANGSLVSIWVNAPEDEWQKPVSGIRLRQVYESIQLDE